MTDEVFEERLINYIYGPNYRPAKPRILAAMLKIEQEERVEFRRILRRLVKQGRVVWGPRHLVLPPEQHRAKLAAEAAVAKRAVAVVEDVEPESDGIDRPATKPEKRRQAERVRETDSAEPNDDGETTSDESDGRETKKRKSADRDRDGETGEGGKNRIGRITGVFRRARAGYGFVRPETSSPGDASFDIFIPASRASDAISGDRVSVRLTALEKDRRSRAKKSTFKSPQAAEKRSGRIVDIIERRRTDFIGVYHETKPGQGHVLLTGDAPRQPITVTDAGAAGVAEGDTVVIELTKFPFPGSDGEGVITEILGAQGELGVETKAVIRQYDLRDEFPEDVLDDAREQSRVFNEQLEAGQLADRRRDLTDQVIVTIDPVDARDFDDAISLTKDADGHWTLGVHIADVSAFVPPGSALDREARLRGTSVYLPGKVLPMLPEVISNHLASLQPDKPRFARTAFITFDPSGLPTHTEITRSLIKSRHRFSYEEVGELLDRPEGKKNELPEGVYDLVIRMAELAKLLREKRMANGSLQMSLPEMKVKLDRDGNAVGAYAVVQDFPHQLIEEFMLAANVAVAERLTDKNVPFLRRVHPEPDPQKLEDLEKFLGDLGITSGPLQDRDNLRKVLAEAETSPLSLAIQYAILRATRKAIYSPADEGHFALHFRQYCHFTSPIRRYPDLTIHRALDKLQDDEKVGVDKNALERLAVQCNDCEDRAEGAERELVKIKLLEYMSTRIGETVEVVLTGVESFGLFAQSVAMPVDGFLPTSSLPTDQWRYDDVGHQLTGKHTGQSFRLGDKLTLELASVDPIRRQLEWRFPGTTGSQTSSPRRSRPLEKAPRKAERNDRDDKPRKSDPSAEKSEKRPGKKKRRDA